MHLTASLLPFLFNMAVGLLGDLDLLYLNSFLNASRESICDSGMFKMICTHTPTAGVDVGRAASLFLSGALLL